MKIAAGTMDNQHSHYAEAVYFISGGKGKITIEGKEEIMEAEIPDGHVMFSEGWTHQVENVGDTDLHAIIFERMPAAL